MTYMDSKFWIDHKSRELVHLERDQKFVLKTKKWWLQHQFRDSQNRLLEWNGWINTNAYSAFDFPKKINGKLHLKHTKEGYSGWFDLGFGKDNFVLTSGVYYANDPWKIHFVKNDWIGEFEANIEDCIVLEYTYVD